MPYTAYGTEYQDLGTHDASEYASAARNQEQQPQQTAQGGGSPSGGGRQQRPVTMNQNTVGIIVIIHIVVLKAINVFVSEALSLPFAIRS